jgi:hypothetical protein
MSREWTDTAAAAGWATSAPELRLGGLRVEAVEYVDACKSRIRRGHPADRASRGNRPRQPGRPLEYRLAIHLATTVYSST